MWDDSYNNYDDLDDTSTEDEAPEEDTSEEEEPGDESDEYTPPVLDSYVIPGNGVKTSELDDFGAVAEPSTVILENFTTVTYAEALWNFVASTTPLTQGTAWDNISSGMVADITTFETELTTLEDAGNWKGATHDAAVSSITQSLVEPKTAAKGSFAIGVLSEYFANTMYFVKKNLVDEHQSYRDAIANWPTHVDQTRQAYNAWTQQLFERFYVPPIKEIAEDHPGFSSGEFVVEELAPPPPPPVTEVPPPPPPPPPVTEVPPPPPPPVTEVPPPVKSTQPDWQQDLNGETPPSSAERPELDLPPAVTLPAVEPLPGRDQPPLDLSPPVSGPDGLDGELLDPTDRLENPTDVPPGFSPSLSGRPPRPPVSPGQPPKSPLEQWLGELDGGLSSNEPQLPAVDPYEQAEYLLSNPQVADIAEVLVNDPRVADAVRELLDDPAVFNAAESLLNRGTADEMAGFRPQLPVEDFGVQPGLQTQQSPSGSPAASLSGGPAEAVSGLFSSIFDGVNQIVETAQGGPPPGGPPPGLPPLEPAGRGIPAAMEPAGGAGGGPAGGGGPGGGMPGKLEPLLPGSPVAAADSQTANGGPPPTPLGGPAGQPGAGAGGGMPPGGGGGGGQNGQSGQDHKPAKVLRGKHNGENIIGGSDAVVSVIGGDSPRPDTGGLEL